jgi:hypothetical protein
MNEAPWHIEVVGNYSRECVVGFLAGRIGAPIHHSPQLLLIDGVREQGTVMALYSKRKAIPLTDDMPLHTISSEDVLQLW